MNAPFDTPFLYQRGANTLPGRMERADTVNAGGQHEHVARPWSREAQSLHSYYGTAPLSADEAGEYRGRGYFVPSSADPVGNSIRADQRHVSRFPGRVQAATELSLNGANLAGRMRVRGTLAGSRTVRRYQAEAGALPLQVARENVVYGGGQHGDLLDPWAREAQSLPYLDGNPSMQDPVGQFIEDDQFMAKGFPGLMASSSTLNLGGRSGLGATNCGPWAPKGKVWDDPRDPFLAFLAVLASGETPVTPPEGATSFYICALMQMKHEYGGDPGSIKVSSWPKLSPELEAAVESAGGKLTSTTSLVLGKFAQKYNWTPAYMERLTRAGLEMAAVDTQDPQWLNTWAEIRPQGGGKANSSSTKDVWYKSPWVWGAAAVVAIGGVWVVTR